jgi:hypothetical protein
MMHLYGLRKRIHLKHHALYPISSNKNLGASTVNLVSKISACTVANIEGINLDFNGGGIAHTVICHKVKETKPFAFLFN